MADVDREELRERIAVILQDYTRWPMTALENITMGRPRDERLLAMATAAAGTDRVIKTLPDGLRHPPGPALPWRHRALRRPVAARRDRAGLLPGRCPAHL